MSLSIIQKLLSCHLLHSDSSSSSLPPSLSSLSLSLTHKEIHFNSNFKRFFSLSSRLLVASVNKTHPSNSFILIIIIIFFYQHFQQPNHHHITQISHIQTPQFHLHVEDQDLLQLSKCQEGSEMAPRVSTTRGPLSHRTSSSDSDPPHHRPVTDRSPKLGDRRSPRSAHSDPLTQKKLGTRIAGLETQLEQAQGELKLLKNQLASAEAAKKEAQKEPNKKPMKTVGSVPDPVPGPGQDTRASPSENQNPEREPDQDPNNEISEETDVFEVPIEMVSVEAKVEKSQTCDQDEVKVKVNTELPEIGVKNEEISLLKLTIEEKDKKLETLGEENEGLKRELSEANVKITSAMVKEESLNIKLTQVDQELQKSKSDGIQLKEKLKEVEGAKEESLNIKLTQVDQELQKSKSDGIQLKEKLKEVEGAKEALETEMKRLRVQTEQWRKAADAAAAILAGGGVEMSDGRRVSERCGSMDKNYGGGFNGYGGFGGSPGLGEDSDDGFGNGKRKGSGIRMFGDLWKKKGHK
ncbi:putative interactor of constitutive active ROPs [Helianthus debilis subsp. tardiflorus]